MDGETLREGIFALHTRRFGSVAEVLIKRLKKLGKYGIFYSDCIAIFHIESGAIGPQIYYSDRQHKGNIGEGQFHINQDTIHIHERDYLYRKLSYDELYELLA